MCEQCVPDDLPASADSHRRGRRAFLSGVLAIPFGATAVAAGATAGPPSVVGASGRLHLGATTPPPIVRRAEWGGDLHPKGTLPAEEVKYLLVHHTAEPGSNYQPDDVVRLLRGIYAFHTGASKGWPDVAYNFFIDKFGRIYEGRTGSVDGPVRGSATGGNQGYSQLCCFLGDFNASPPPAPALGSMYSLLAWLGDRYGVDTSPGARVTFTSLGSNKWPAGATVDAATISAHRDMSETTCPGDACYALVRSTFPVQVSALRAQNPTPTAAPTTTVTQPTELVSPATSVPEPAAPAATTSTNPDKGSAGFGSGSTSTTSDGRNGARWPLLAAVGVAAAGVGAVAVARRRSTIEVGATAIAWRITGGAKDPFIHALATTARSVVGTSDGWWDEVADQWRSTTPRTGDAANPSDNDPSSFLLATDGRRAVVRLTGGATGDATMADGSIVALTQSGTTKIWLTGTAVSLNLDGQVTELSEAGIHGPVDRTMSPPG